VLIIPYFIHHQGCPHRCLFCNQFSISGAQRQESAGTVSDLTGTIEDWLARSAHHDEIQVAFYGGSFTCLDEALQFELLQAVAPYIEAKRVNSIRLSTRPDCVTEALGDFLLCSGVSTVEIGAQSMRDEVLERSGRGHTVADIERAAKLLAGRGLRVGIQLMAGLPGETTRSFMEGIRRVVQLAPDLVRIYPTVVLNGTALADLYRRAGWKPLSLERAVILTGRARDLFAANNISVARMGLQPSTELEQQLLAGPYHPAFGELVLSRMWYRRVRKLLLQAGTGTVLKLSISERDYSAFAGLKKHNLKRLRRVAGGARLLVEIDPALRRGDYRQTIE
jgi:histone acetyltransferase (RNA polymerase elongator complex component)